MGIQILSRLLHHYIPSHVGEDCPSSTSCRCLLTPSKSIATTPMETRETMRRSNPTLDTHIRTAIPTNIIHPIRRILLCYPEMNMT